MGKAVKTPDMLYYALIFLVVALAAGLLGFLALAGIAAMIARVLFVLFLVFFLISLFQRRRLYTCPISTKATVNVPYFNEGDCKRALFQRRRL
jgi:uncharacterized membrane protein YtjA (UPF0391 family)